VKQTRGPGSSDVRPSRASSSQMSSAKGARGRSLQPVAARTDRTFRKTGPRKPASRKAENRTMDGGFPRRPGRLPSRLTRIGIHPERRVRFLLLTGFFILSLFAAQLFRLQALDASSMASAALRSRLTVVAVPALRGNITASNGEVLATSIARSNVTADQTAVPTYSKKIKGVTVKVGVAGAAADLAPILGKSVAELSATLTGARRFVYVDKDVSMAQWNEVQALGIPGIYSEATSQRSYPTSSAAASLLGWVGADGSPGGGLELLLNSQLQGRPGVTTYERSADGRTITTAENQVTPAVPGQDVRLTIDSNLQWYAQNILAQQVNETKALSGTVVVMGVKTGQLMAVASYPSFDPNNIASATGDLNDRAFADAFEPGSTAKVMTAAAAIQQGVATAATPVVVPDRLARGGQLFRDSHEHGVEHLTFAGVIAQSSDIGTMTVGEKVPPATLEKYFRSFGIGQPTGINFPGETPGIFAKSQDWSGSQRYTVMYGQGLSVNAIQDAGVFQTVANGGLRVPPSLVASTTSADGTVTPASPTKPVRVISPSTAKTLSQMLEFVVSDNGTAVAATIPGYRVAGKTGTANRVDADGHYSGYTASFIGFAPADKPQFVVAVILQNPLIGIYGGAVAAPVFKDVMTYALQEFAVPPTGTPPPVMELTVGDPPATVDKAAAALQSQSGTQASTPAR
jgi:cell division protein FtsI (penicillin-binding protein 3)